MALRAFREVRNVMHRKLAAPTGALMLAAVAALPASAAEQVLPELKGEAEQGGGTAGPEAVFRNGCILFPGQKLTYRFRAGFPNNFYSVAASSGFDVVMRVALKGFRAVTVDRRGRGGTERINFSSPTRSRPVAVTISGFRGSMGCFAFAARP